MRGASTTSSSADRKGRAGDGRAVGGGREGRVGARRHVVAGRDRPTSAGARGATRAARRVPSGGVFGIVRPGWASGPLVCGVLAGYRKGPGDGPRTVRAVAASCPISPMSRRTSPGSTPAGMGRAGLRGLRYSQHPFAAVGLAGPRVSRTTPLDIESQPRARPGVRRRLAGLPEGTVAGGGGRSTSRRARRSISPRPDRRGGTDVHRAADSGPEAEVIAAPELSPCLHTSTPWQSRHLTSPKRCAPGSRPARPAVYCVASADGWPMSSCTSPPSIAARAAWLRCAVNGVLHAH